MNDNLISYSKIEMILDFLIPFLLLANIIPPICR